LSFRISSFAISLAGALALTACGGGSNNSTPSNFQVTVAVTGTGTVTSSPAGIDCPTTCTASFAAGTSVTLSASAGTGFTFAGFGGVCSGTSCQVTSSGSVTATFNQKVPDITSIKHIVVIMQENRSFDHYFGHLMDYWQEYNYPQATNGTTFDGEPANASNPDPNGNAVTAFNLQSGCTENPSPSWNESHVDRNHENPTDSNNGPSDTPMDGFVRAAAGDAQGDNFYDVLGHRAMGYFVGDNQLNYYYFMASNFATSDRWFSPVMSRTQLNRMYLYGASSYGHAYPLPSNSSPLTGKTIFELMQDNNVSWKIYVHPDSTNCTTPQCLAKYTYLNQWAYVTYVVQNLPNQLVPESQLISDIQNGTLPQVSFLEPAGYVELDEHPGTDDNNPVGNLQTGVKYIAGIMNTLMNSPSWKDTVLIFTYDESGGFYDHVPPQPAVPPGDGFNFPTDLISSPPDICLNDTTDQICGFYYTGYRLPLIVISPFTVKNYVSHTVMDYTAILKLIETRFNLPSLTARDAAQPDMTEFFDFVNMPWATPPNPPQPSSGMPCILEALSGVSITPSPAPAGGQATVTLSLAEPAPTTQNVVVSLSASSPNVVPPNATIAEGTSSVSFPITVPTGITSLTVTGSIGGIPVSGTAPVQ
jgi:phospholipase C